MLRFDKEKRFRFNELRLTFSCSKRLEVVRIRMFINHPAKGINLMQMKFRENGFLQVYC